MSRFPKRRLVAATVLAVTLAVFTLPAAAAPLGGTSGAWELPTLLSWFDSLWTGIFGGEQEVTGTSGPSSIHEQIRGDAEPDGLMDTSTVTSDGEETTPQASGNVW